MDARKIDVRPISEQERTTIRICNHEYVPADRISPFAIWCVKCGQMIIRDPADRSCQEMYSPPDCLGKPLLEK